MKRKGSITVFLALVLILLFSFVLTTLEAARIAGGKAYVQMVSAMAGDSVKAGYYYPMFERYGLFGIPASDENGYASESFPEGKIERYVTYMLNGLEGGLFVFDLPQIRILDKKTMLSDGAESFLEQLREQAALEITEKGLFGWIKEAGIQDAVQAGELYQKQETVMEETTAITQDLLKLMELTDGIRTGENGLYFDKNGKLQVNQHFLKQILPLSQEEFEEKYENQEIFNAVKEHLDSPKKRAEELAALLGEIKEQSAELSVLKVELEEYRERQKELMELLGQEMTKEQKEKLEAEQEILVRKQKEAIGLRDEKTEWMDIAQMDAMEQYENLKGLLEGVFLLYDDALELVERLERKQKAASLSIAAYEIFLKGKEAEISAELYAVFEGELQNMKLYAGMEEAGYHTGTMKKTLQENKGLLSKLCLPEYGEKKLEELIEAVQRISEDMCEYAADGLWFSYGTVAVTDETGKSAAEQLSKIISEGVLEFVGLSEEELSEREWSGTELPSAGLAKESAAENLLDCFKELSLLFEEKDILGILEEGLESSWNLLALEWYARTAFGCHGRELANTKALYEREYLLFGKQSDMENLCLAVLYLTALRMMFSMVTILKDPAKMQAIETLAVSVAGFTGVPLLLSAVKYTVLLLWSVEEALIETTALLSGKRIPVFSGEGRLSLQEVFTFSKTTVKKKADGIQETGGMKYEDYLTVLSLLQSIEKKAYRSMDLIQETMRFLYDDAFRMRNMVTGFTAEVRVSLVQKIRTGIWDVQGYRLCAECTEKY